MRGGDDKHMGIHSFTEHTERGDQIGDLAEPGDEQ
jgi:hypothetical protein